MTKFFVVLLVVSLVAFVSASDDDDDSGPSSIFGDDAGGVFGDLLKPLSSFGHLGQDFVKHFKPPPGGEGEAHSISTSHVEKTVNGKKVQDESKLDKVDNVDGDLVNEEHLSN